jgi:four helix bundle protein
MSKIERFEDIKSWQEARKLTARIYTITRNGSFARDISLRDQLRRSSVSIMANIAEGFGRRSNKEFSNFLNMAHGSTAEVQSHLYVALDQTYIARTDFENFYSKADEISKMIQAFMKYLTGKKK